MGTVPGMSRRHLTALALTTTLLVAGCADHPERAVVPTSAPTTTTALAAVDEYARGACGILDAARVSGTDSDPSTMRITADQARQSSVTVIAVSGRALEERTVQAASAKGQSDEARAIAAMVTAATDLATACKLIGLPD